MNGARKHSTKRLTLLAMCFSLFMAGMDTTVVNLALPSIRRSLTASLSDLQWIVDSYILVVACLMLNGGTLGDVFGRKRLFMLGLSLFTIGSVICAMAPSAGKLILGRSITDARGGIEHREAGHGTRTLSDFRPRQSTDTFRLSPHRSHEACQRG